MFLSTYVGDYFNHGVLVTLCMHGLTNVNGRGTGERIFKSVILYEV